jgi:imidazolonepropionase-like amidohydrolase
MNRLVVGSYFDGERHHDDGPFAILHRDGTITAIEHTVGEPAEAAFVMPTLVDAHVHVFLDGAELDGERRKRHLTRTTAELLDAARANAEAARHTGIGILRDAGDPHGVNHSLRDELAVGAGGVRLRSPGCALHRPGRYGSFLGAAVADDRDLAMVVRDRCADADDVKVLLTGVIDFATAAVKGRPQFDRDAATAIVAAARAMERPAFAHCNGAEGLAIAIAAGFTSIEHGYFVDEESLRAMAGEGVAWTPTLAPVAAQRALDSTITGFDDAIHRRLDDILAAHADQVARAAQLGVVLLCGSDAGGQGVPHGSGLIDEMLLMAAAGVPLEAVLRAATSHARARLNEPPAAIRAGARFELVALPRSPFDDIQALQAARRLSPAAITEGRPQ